MAKVKSPRKILLDMFQLHLKAIATHQSGTSEGSTTNQTQDVKLNSGDQISSALLETQGGRREHQLQPIVVEKKSTRISERYSPDF